MNITTDREQIQKWAERFQGVPQLIDHGDARGDKKGLRIEFPQSNDQKYLSDANPPKAISWDEFFRTFEELKLAVILPEDEVLSDPSWSYRFIDRAEIDVTQAVK